MKGIIIVIIIVLSTTTYSCSSKKNISKIDKNLETKIIKNDIDIYVREIDKIAQSNDIVNNESVKLTNEVLKNITDEETFYNKEKIIKIVIHDLFVNNYKRELTFYYRGGKVIFIKSKQKSLLKKDVKFAIRKIYYNNGVVIFDSLNEDRLDNELLVLAENSLKERYKNYN